MKKIEFDSDLYSKNAILRAVKDYAQIASISMVQKNSRIVCVLVKSRYDEEKTIREFSNYVIDCTNQGSLHESH